MIAGHIVIDGMNYTVREGTISELRPDGQPTGKQVRIKALLVKDNASGLTVELRMTPEQFDAFAAAMAGRKTIIPNGGFKL